MHPYRSLEVCDVRIRWHWITLVTSSSVQSLAAQFSSPHALCVLTAPRRLLLYGRYCSQVETATKHLDKLSNLREDIKMKLEVHTDTHTHTLRILLITAQIM